jgi:hypothetical protein
MATGEWKHITELIGAALAILNEQQPMTIRQLFYALCGSGTDPEYAGPLQTSDSNHDEGA